MQVCTGGALGGFARVQGAPFLPVSLPSTLLWRESVGMEATIWGQNLVEHRLTVPACTCGEDRIRPVPTHVVPVCHHPMVAARSRSRSQRFTHVSDPQPPIDPSAWMTRWQGTTGENGQRLMEPPAARAARG